MDNHHRQHLRLASVQVLPEAEEALSQEEEEAVDFQEAAASQEEADFQEAALVVPDAEDFPVEADLLTTKIMVCHLEPLPRLSLRTLTPGGARPRSSMEHGPPIKLGLAE